MNRSDSPPFFLVVAIGAAVLWLSTAPLQAAGTAGAPSFVPLGLIDGPASLPVSSTAISVSNSGNVVVGHADPASVDSPLAFKWTVSTGMTPLIHGPSDQLSSYAVSVSATGDVAVGSRTRNAIQEGFKRDERAGQIAFFRVDAAELTVPRAVSGDGRVVVGSLEFADGTERAFRFDGTDFAILPDVPNGVGRHAAVAASYDGSVIVGTARMRGSIQTVGFQWTAAAGSSTLPDAVGGGLHRNAYGVSADGAVVVGNASPDGVSYRPAIWRSGQAPELYALPPGHADGAFHSVSGTGRVAVGLARAEASSQTRAILWTPESGMRFLDSLPGLGLPDGWTLREATSISNDGTAVVGVGTNEGVEEAFLILAEDGFEGRLKVPFLGHPVLELAALSAFALVASVLGRTRERRRGQKGSARAAWSPCRRPVRLVDRVIQAPRSTA